MSNRNLAEYVEKLIKEGSEPLDTLPDKWYNDGIFTPEEYIRYQNEQDFLEMYEEIHGHPSTIDLALLSDDALEAKSIELWDQLELAIEDARDVFESIEGGSSYTLH